MSRGMGALGVGKVGSDSRRRLLDILDLFVVGCPHQICSGFQAHSFIFSRLI